MMAERHRLRRLQVGEARHHRVGMFVGARDQRVEQAAEGRARLIDRVAHPQAEIGRDLVVAAARGVEPPGDRADLVGQPRLGQHVDVLEREVVGHAVAGIIGGDLIESGG